MKKICLEILCFIFLIFNLHAEENQVLRKWAAECASVVEMGVGSMASTWDILQGLSESSHPSPSYLGIDVAYPSSETLHLAQTFAEKNGIHFTFWQADKQYIVIEPTDMLIVDSLHALESFASQVRKYICLHGTEDLEFLARHPEWVLLEHGTFTVLKRVDETVVPEPFSDHLVHYYLKEKIILCTGPAFDRYPMLKQSTESDLALIPFNKVFVITNEPSIVDITFHGKKPSYCELIPNRGKHIDCINCIVHTMKKAVNDPEVQDDDIILFKHESVFINDMGLIKKAIHKVVCENYNMVTRNMAQWHGITATDAFFVKVAAIREIVKDYPDIQGLPHDSWFCEAYFHNYIVKHIPHIYGIYYDHSNGYFNELGFYHYPSGPESGRPAWNRYNHDELFHQPSYVK